MRRSQQRCQIRADGVKGDKAHIQQAGIADHNIQPQRQHNVEQGEVDDPHPVVAAELAGDHRRHQQRADQQGHPGPEAAGDGRRIEL